MMVVGIVLFQVNFSTPLLAQRELPESSDEGGGIGNLDEQQDVHFKAVDINGHSINTAKEKNKVLLLLFFDPMKTVQKGSIAYAQVLFGKYREKGLAIIGVTQNEPLGDNLKNYITFPLVVDTDGKIQERFNVKDCCGGTVLFQKDGKIKFRMSNLVNSNTLRQLVEKELLGKVAYEFKAPQPQNLFVLNRKAPGIEFVDAYSKQLKTFLDIKGEKLIVTFFSSICSFCKSGKRLDTLVRLKDHLKIRSNKAVIILIFFKPYDENDIAQWESRFPMPFEKYISDDIFTNEEKYVTEDSLKTDPLTVVLTGNQKVIFLEKTGLTEEQLFNRVLKKVDKPSAGK